MNDCEKPILGPLGSVVGHCDKQDGHKGPCSINGVTEAMMVDTLNRVDPQRQSFSKYHSQESK